MLRISLLIAAFINILIVYTGLSENNKELTPEKLNQYSANIESAFFSVIAFFLAMSTDIIEKQQNIDIPDILEIAIVVFIYAGIFLSVQFNLYYTLWWWDDLLHTLSGVIIGFIGFIVVFIINHKYSMNINPFFVALFSFTFAVTIGVIWEIMEFSVDIFLGSAHQKWDLPATEIMMGKAYQGSGLRDTMSDLIVDSVGALVTSVYTYFVYKNKKKYVIGEMKRMIKKHKHISSQ
jgi:tetrahydromethanopterin S-methyltransferase subunit E